MEILRQIRLLPHASSMPVMMLNSKGGRLLKSRGEQTGADDYLVKPIEPEELVSRVEALSVGRVISQTVMRSSPSDGATLRAGERKARSDRRRTFLPLPFEAAAERGRQSSW